MPHVTPELVGKAYAAMGNALTTGDLTEFNQYWAEDMNWLVPGHNPLSGWYHGSEAFLNFMRTVGGLSANSFNMETITVLTNDEYSADVTHNVGFRAAYRGSGEEPYTKLDIDVIHLLRWRDGKVIEGRGAIFGDGANRYDMFWSPVARDSERS